MRLAILICLLPLLGFGQNISKDGTSIMLSIPEAARIDYWGRKGIQSEPLLSTYELNIKLLETKVDFKDTIIKNLGAAQEEYRSNLQKMANSNAELVKDLYKTKEDLEKFKGKAKRRGAFIAACGAVALALGVAVILQ